MATGSAYNEDYNPDFMKMRLKVGDAAVKADFDRDLHIPDDPEDLMREIAKYPALYFYYSSLAERSKHKEEELKRRYELWEAQKYLEAKTELTKDSDGKRVTEALIKSTVSARYAEDIGNWSHELERAAYKTKMLQLASKAMLEKGTAAINILSYKKTQLNDANKA